MSSRGVAYVTYQSTKDRVEELGLLGDGWERIRTLIILRYLKNEK